MGRRNELRPRSRRPRLSCCLQRPATRPRLVAGVHDRRAEPGGSEPAEAGARGWAGCHSIARRVPDAGAPV